MRRFLSKALSIALAVPAIGVIAHVATAPSAAGATAQTASWTVTTSNWDRSSSPTIADVNGDGTPEVVIGHQDGWVRVLNGSNGSEIAGWPRPAIISGGSPTAIDSTPAVADLFKNGGHEVIVAAGSNWAAGTCHCNPLPGGVIVFNSDGTTHCVFQTRAVTHGVGEPVFSSPAIGDVDGDGFPDIVFGSFDLHIYAINRNCQKIIDYNVEDSVWSSPALYDIDGDGRQEIFIGGDQTAGGAIDWSGGEFRALKWSPFAPGGAYELWKRQINDTVWSSPAIGDIDGDGRVEVVVGAGSFYQRDDGRRVFAWHADDGSVVPGWPVSTAGWTMPSPALGDVNGDGVPEVAVSSTDGWERMYRGNGSLLWATRLTFNNSSPGGPVDSPIIADMNGDGHNDVGAGNDWGFWIMNGANGAVMAYNNTWVAHETAGAVGHFSNGWKLIVDGFDTPNHTTKLQAFDIPAPGVTPPWPMFRHDAAHKAGPIGKNLLPPGYCARTNIPTPHPNSASSQGYWVLGSNGSVYALHGAPYKGGAQGRAWPPAVGIAATHTGGGYYILDSAGQIFAFGDAKSHGSMAGRPLNAPIIALAPTPSGNGYWLLGRDGGVFTFGDARFYGSTGNKRLNAPIISMTATTTGRGYWLLASDGGVFTFGDAKFHGSTGNMRLNAPVISMAAAPSGAGYWLIARDGGVFSFNVPFYGSLPGEGLCRAPEGMQIRPTLTGKGYFMLAADGTVWPFGDAVAGQSAPPLTLFNYGSDLTVRP